MGSMLFSVTKPPEKGGFDEKCSNTAIGGQQHYVTKPPEKGGFVTQYRILIIPIPPL
jgi:hypothetical protein